MNDSSGAKKQKTSSKDAKDDGAMNTLFDILDRNIYFIKLIQQFLDAKETASFLEVLKLGLFNKKVDSGDKTKNEKRSIAEAKDFEKTLDIFLANCKQLYLLIERYQEEFPSGTYYRDKIPTPIVCACQHGRMEDVELFVNLHPFHKYITNRDLNGYRDDMTLKDMVSQVGTNSRGVECTPLMEAARREDFQMVKYLIAKGADPNIANSGGYNALHYATNNRTSTELIELLVTNMTLASINKKHMGGYTPLDEAYLNNDHSPIKQEIIALLRSKGGKANCFDENGRMVGRGNGDLNQLLKF